MANTIRLELTADSSGAITGIKQVETGLESLDKAAKKNTATMEEHGKKLAASIGVTTERLDAMFKMADKAFAAAAALGALTAAAGATAKAVFDATNEAIAYGGKMSDLSAKTGLSAVALQKLEHAARLTGSSTEQLSGAITKMQKGLVDGSKGFDALGLSQQQLLAMKPEEAFGQVADAIRKIEDPAQQAAAAIAVFGKSGAELLPLLKSNMAEAAAEAEHLGHVLSDDTVEALDAVGDAADTLEATWTSMWRQIGATIAEQPEVVEALKGITEVLGAITRGAKPATEAMLGYFGAIDKFVLGGNGQQLLTMLRELGHLMGGDPAVKTPGFGPMDAPGGIGFGGIDARAIDVATKNVKTFEAAAKKAADETERIAKALAAAAATSMPDLTEALRALEEQRALLLRSNPLPTGGAGTSGLADTPGSNLSGMDAWAAWYKQHGAKAAAEAGKKAGIDWRASFTKALEGLPAVILAAIQGGGDVGRSIGAALGGAMATDLAKSLGEKLTGTLGKMLGSLIPGLGGILGSLAGGLLGRLGGLFGGGEVRQVNRLRDAFVEAAGGITELDRRAQAAGLTVQRLLNAQSVREYEAAIRELQDAFDAQAEAQRLLNEAVERYGFTLEELGPTFARQRLDEQAAQLLQDWYLLNAAGIDHNAILARMAPSINEYVANARRAGQAIPEAMRPILQALIDEGKLLDENGRAYTSLEEVGVTFAESMTEQFTRLLDSIQRLVDALTGLDGRTVNTRVNVHTHHSSSSDGGSSNGSNTWDGSYNYDGSKNYDGDFQTPAASGGSWMMTGPRSGYPAPLTLHGRERVTVVPEGKAAQGGGDSALLREVRGMRAELRRLPYMVRDVQMQRS